MKKDTRPHLGVSKSNASASARAAARAQHGSSNDRLDAPAAAVTTCITAPAVQISARYIDSRLKQFCLR
ncbi:MAG: hypothetical protein QOF78_13 [Phycisphaerales bacterium]|nr:hypothetical protein [Phycisphaerales bacterium]